MKFSDKRNIDIRKVNSFFNYDDDIYFIVSDEPEKFNQFIFERKFFYFFQSQKESINININDFVVFCGKTNASNVITTLLSASEQFHNKVVNFKTTKEVEVVNNFIINKKVFTKELKIAEILVDGMNFARKLSTMPGNILTTERFEVEVKEKFASLNDKVKIVTLDKQTLIKKNMNLILAVGNQSNEAQHPKIIEIDYKSSGSPNLSIIGKGITFDTGGLNLKKDKEMFGMHADMTGAAISVAVAYVAAKLNLKCNISCIACLASNEIGPDAYRVNDVITSYSGRTVEIIDTDAEGRLILADGISYANKDLHAETIITVATLSGSLQYALGNTFTAIWSNTDKN
jgi:leucyl aminopeptidase